jgi:hypothetical protein
MTYLLLLALTLLRFSDSFGSEAATRSGLSEEIRSPFSSAVGLDTPLPPTISISWQNCAVVSTTNLTGSLQWQLCKVYLGQILEEWAGATGSSIWRQLYYEPDDFVVRVRPVGTTAWTTSSIRQAKKGCCCP